MAINSLSQIALAESVKGSRLKEWRAFLILRTIFLKIVEKSDEVK